MVAPQLNKLVAALPDVYQPIFEHSELSQGVTRVCEDRLSFIIPIYRALAAHLERPLRVLDLGCAQGFFCLHLAKLGAIAHGVDFLDLNIAVCDALAAEHPDLKVSFQTSPAEKIISHITLDQYDLVLGLSIFHHLIHDCGLMAVEGMFATLAKATSAGIFELAWANEPTKLKYERPQNPRDLLAAFSFVHELARIPTQMAVVTHPSSAPTVISRPLYVASSRYRFGNNQADPLTT